MQTKLEKYMNGKTAKRLSKRHIVVRRHYHRRSRVMSQTIARSSLSVLKVGNISVLYECSMVYLYFVVFLHSKQPKIMLLV